MAPHWWPRRGSHRQVSGRRDAVVDALATAVNQRLFRDEAR